MFKKVILGISMFYCIAFGTVSAHTTDCFVEDKETQETKFSVNPERLFFESGRLYLETEGGKCLPLKSITYENGRCNTVLASEAIQSMFYSQGYRCNSVDILLSKQLLELPEVALYAKEMTGLCFRPFFEKE